MASERLFFEAIGDRVALIRETPSRLPFTKPARSAVPFEDWVLARPLEASAGLARLLQALDDQEAGSDQRPLVASDADGARLHAAFVARLTDSEAQGLGLPPATRLALNLRSSGLIHRPGFRIDTHWTRSGGVPVQARVANGRLNHQGREWRVPEPLFSALARVAEVNAAPDETARQAALAELKRAMGDEAADRISADGVIERLRLSYASGFSLSLKPSAAGFDFDPVLFGRERLDEAEEGIELDEAEDSLLPPALAAGFVRRFRAGDGARRTYLLDDGSLLFLDPQLSRALGVVRTAQRGSPEERRAFAVNPERQIAEALRASGEEPSDATRLFVETQQFSERVAGIDIWRKPVLPWIKPKPNSWLPESFGLRVGDPPDAQMVEIAPDRVLETKEAAERAVKEELSSFRYDDQEIPATQAAVEALSDLAKLVEDAQHAAGDITTEPSPETRQRYFLQVRDNLEEVDYAPLVSEAAAVEAPAAEIPAAVRSTPKPHQVEGFQWLAACWRSGMPGALLADDMGLGKTFQALAWLAWLREQGVHQRPVLIVAPTGLLANWRAEIKRHLEPDALGRIAEAYGSGLATLRTTRGRDIELGESALDPQAWSHAGIVLTTYETMRDYHLSFARQPFAAIIYDEAQKLKNPASQMTRAAKTLNARFQLAMTGTPVENRLQDLWSIYDVIHPGLLGSSKSFESEYPATAERLKALHDRLATPQAGRPPFLLRRMKDDCLAGLPTKRVEAMPAPMPPMQAEAYRQVVSRALAVKGSGDKGRMLKILHQLRGVSLHPVDPEEGGADAAYFGDSARLSTLFNLLAKIASAGEKVLIFCESLSMQALLAAEIRRRFALPHVVARIHGGVTGDARQAAVDAFQDRPDGFDAMILSPKAGGVGLTLTAANHVIHLSRWWNPAVEDQATDRAYRIGQTRDVTVYLPQSVHPDPAIGPTSFDLKLHALMERKRVLSRGLLAPGDDDGDASALFESVVAGDGDEIVSERESDLDGQAEPAIERVEEPTAPVVARILLSVRSAADETPVIAQAAAPPSWPRRMVYQAGGARDLSIFSRPVEDDPVRELVIIDPYAAAGDRARQALVDFVAMIAGGSAGPEEVRLITFDADSVELYNPESSDLQYRDLQDRWRRQFGPGSALQHFQRSKRQDRNLHDREVRATTRSGRKLIWDLGRGIDGVMQNRHGCRVTLTEE